MKNILSKMHIQEHTEILAKGVSKEVKFKLGKRDATLFTKSPEYGQLLDNNHINDELIHQDIKRAMKTTFAESFTIGSDFGENADIFEDAVDPEEEQQANDDAAREEINRQEREREDQHQRMAEHVQRQTEEMFNNIPNKIDRSIREASRAQASGLLQNVYKNALAELETRNRNLRENLKLEGKDRSKDFDTKSVDFQNEGERWAQARKRTREIKQPVTVRKNSRQKRTQARVEGQKKGLIKEKARIAGEKERANELFEKIQMGKEDINRTQAPRPRPPPMTEAQKEAALREKQQRERLTNKNRNTAASSSSSSGAARAAPTGPHLQQIRDFLERLYHNHQLQPDDDRGYETLVYAGQKPWQFYKTLDPEEKAQAERYLRDMYARYKRRFPDL